MKKNVFFFAILVFVSYYQIKEKDAPTAARTKVARAPESPGTNIPHLRTDTLNNSKSPDEDFTEQEKDLSSLKKLIVAQALQMTKLQEQPELIDAQLAETAQRISKKEALYLTGVVKDFSLDQNQRIIALDLLTRQPLKNLDFLLDILSRDDFPRDLHMEKGVHGNTREHFEYVVSLHILRRLEPQLVQDPQLRRRIYDIAQTAIPSSTKEHIFQSLDAAEIGKLRWTEIAQSFTPGVQ
ncbi:MAG: hypothetical protein OM95_16725 [Bdellovibrio sp. ArHS]|uniref:hypothetical protein n=1 Tax=Bdellovibrio sp. ArHS TaxID=1569284 RepID=UPI000582EBF7|nr:hypothetical protein [Bdellovibrio sp. ArHS]KHD87024.1 MAG: hypothetical protein OM95_16725 [Bdellovibrio sp. ArHS]